MKLTIFFLVVLTLLFFVTTQSQTHKVFTDVLQKYVKYGLVDYKAFKQDQKFETYLNKLSNTDLSQLSEREELAFWINTYNAFTLKAIIDNYPVKSINDIKYGEKSVWDEDFIPINKKKYSLNEIEHKILRVRFDEPRIHFAIVCASISCPALRNEAFDANKLEAQLQEESVRFLTDKDRNDFDLSKRTAYLSKIFDWFDEDFGKNDKEILQFVSKFLPDNIKKDMLENTDKWKINYKDYNWNLNEIK
ncbi:MAG: DUF547 domain-containing protein [Ignavibacteriaceae bacterium]